MKIKTSYDCEIEGKDIANLEAGHALTATLSDGSVAFRFRMDPAILNGTPHLVKGRVVVDAPKALADGTPKPTKKYGHRGTCFYCKRGPLALEPHIRTAHPGQPLHPNGKFRCPQCIQRYSTAQGLALHLRMTHKESKKKV